MPEIPFPVSTAPGTLPSEGGGRLINVYAEKAGGGARNQFVWRRSPGLRPRFTIGSDPVRGALQVGTTLYAVAGTTAYTITVSSGVYTVTALTGDNVGGDGPVFMARNMAATADVLVVHTDGMTEIDVSAGTTADFSDPDLPAVNSICWMDGYFFVTSLAGRCYASGINATTFGANDYATAESSPDGLVRAIASGRDLLLMGEATTEFWGNTGNATGFPFTRATVIPHGLYGKYAVAGHEEAFPGDIVWVAADQTVRRLSGYTAQRVSTPDIERLISAVSDTTQIEASAFVAAGHDCIAITGPDWTWVYDQSTGQWHERKSYLEDRWRANFGVYALGEWITFDRTTTDAYAIDDTYNKENLAALVCEARSNQMHSFPSRTLIDRAAFDFESGVGMDAGVSVIETDPSVRISWSDDGGRTWGNPLTRPLGTEGERKLVDIRRVGQAGPKGRQYKWVISDPVDVAFYGASHDVVGVK